MELYDDNAVVLISPCQAVTVTFTVC